MNQMELQELSKKLSCADVLSLLSQYDYVVSSSAEGTRYITIPESSLKYNNHSQTA